LRSIRRGILMSIGSAVLLIWILVPFYWAFIMSISPEVELLSIPPHWLPEQPQIDSFKAIFGTEVLFLGSGHAEAVRNGLVNSLIVSVVTMVIGLSISVIAGYVFGRYNFRGKGVLLFVLLTTRMLPPAVIIVPYFYMFLTLGLTGTILGLVITYISIVLPLLTWLLVGFFASQPRELERAARTDGCTRFQVMRKVSIPLAAPGIVAAGALAFLLAWNEFFFALILTSGTSAQTLPPALAGLFVHVSRYSLLGAGTVLSAIPTIILALVFNKYVTRLQISDPLSL
jgi:multiple sugar transport system permease protein